MRDRGDGATASGGYWEAMARYKVSFDGAWQGSFDIKAAAVAWAEEVPESGRVAYVAKRAGLRTTLVAVRPDTPENRARWKPDWGRAGPAEA